jgi:hypothetical protein
MQSIIRQANSNMTSINAVPPNIVSQGNLLGLTMHVFRCLIDTLVFAGPLRKQTNESPASFRPIKSSTARQSNFHRFFRCRLPLLAVLETF